MTPGPPCRLTCPHCGGHKYIMSIASGNTFGATIWSDSKRDYPMLPQPSVVQYCPHCGHYFFFEDAERTDVMIDREKRKISWGKLIGKEQEEDVSSAEEYRAKWKPIEEDVHRNHFGELTFEQTDQAFDELFMDDLSDERKNQLLFLWLFKYNDVFGGRQEGGNATVCTASISAKRMSVLRMLIDCNDGNDLFVAELYRELGQFDKCIEIVAPIAAGDDNGAIVAKQFMKQAEIGNSRVFPLVFEE